VSAREIRLSEAANGSSAISVEVWLSNCPIGEVYVAVRATTKQVCVNVAGLNFDTFDDSALLGPITATDWMESRSFTVSAYDDAAAEWSIADSIDEKPLHLRFEGQNGDDVLILHGVSTTDAR